MKIIGNTIPIFKILKILKFLRKVFKDTRKKTVGIIFSKCLLGVKILFFVIKNVGKLWANLEENREFFDSKLSPENIEKVKMTPGMKGTLIL